MTLVFAVMHLYNILEIFIASVHSFFILFSNLVLINRRNGPRYQRVQALCACFCFVLFFVGGSIEGTNTSNILWLMFVYVLFYVKLCQD